MRKHLLIAILAIVLAIPALADGGRGWGRGGGHDGGHGGGWGWSGGWIFPALIGGALLYEATRPPAVYVQPAPIYEPSYMPSYAPEPAPQVVQYWYFCPASNAYYPYVRSCPSGWQAVPTTPPDAAAR